MATIEERKNGNGVTMYRAKVRLRGHPSQSETFARKTDAKQWAQQTETEMRRGQHFKTSEAKRHTLKALLQRYQDEHLPHSRKRPRHIEEQKRQIAWLMSELGDYVLFDLTPARIVEARDRLLKKRVRDKPVS